MRRIPWVILLALLAGLGLGLGYSWIISPTRVTDAAPVALRADFKDHYRSAIAAAYAANGNLPRAQERLALLADADPVEALNCFLRTKMDVLVIGNVFIERTRGS